MTADEQRTVHLTKKEFDELITKTRLEAYDKGYHNGYNDARYDTYDR